VDPPKAGTGWSRKEKTKTLCINEDKIASQRAHWQQWALLVSSGLAYEKFLGSGLQKRAVYFSRSALYDNPVF
jgi:hypothetical protein